MSNSHVACLFFYWTVHHVMLFHGLPFPCFERHRSLDKNSKGKRVCNDDWARKWRQKERWQERETLLTKKKTCMTNDEKVLRSLVSLVIVMFVFVLFSGDFNQRSEGICTSWAREAWHHQYPLKVAADVRLEMKCRMISNEGRSNPGSECK